LANGFRGLMLILRVTLTVARSQSNGQKELCGTSNMEQDLTP